MITHEALRKEIHAEFDPRASLGANLSFLQDLLLGYRETIANPETSTSDHPFSPDSAMDGAWQLGHAWAKNDLAQRNEVVNDPVEPAVTPTAPVLYFGCRRGTRGYTAEGHSLYDRDGLHHGLTPWGRKIDGGLLPQEERYGVIYASKREGWTVIAFWDQSGDHRSGSNSAFLIAADITPHDLLQRARQQWPEIFMRTGFPTLMMIVDRATLVVQVLL